VGMIHLPPLPGAPNSDGRSVAEIAEVACEDARRLERGGLDAILLQNANDHPPRAVIPQPTVAAYAVVASAVRVAVNLPIGISVLKSDPDASFAIAVAAGASFVRLKSYVGVEVGAEGLVQGCAAQAVRLRRELGALDRIEIWADAIQPTSHPLGPSSVAELAAWCVDFGEADRIVLTGSTLDESLAFIEEARTRVSAPIILGGGVNPSTAARALAAADGLIVGRFLRGRSLTGPIDLALVREFMSAARSGEHATARAATGGEAR
jgi:membrane complex biogenesis BtpA family protein